jgi:radical SAM protein with 4Fe4S-binding SPASM domain
MLKELASGQPNEIKVIKVQPSAWENPSRCHEVMFYQSFLVRFVAQEGMVQVFYQPEADAEILVDDVFQMALSELLRDQEGWVFHASGVGYRDQSLLLLGSSGSGKSTTCLTLLLQGFTLLGDDATVVLRRNGDYRAVATAREVSVRLNSLALLPDAPSLVLHPVGDRYFWREARISPVSLPLRVISSLELTGEADTFLKEVPPGEFLQQCRQKRAMHGFNLEAFDTWIAEVAANSGQLRFVRGRLGLSTEGIGEAYRACLDDPGKGYWHGRGSSRVIPLVTGQKLVKECWSGDNPAPLEELIPILAHPSQGLASSALGLLAAEPLSRLEPLPWEDYEGLWPASGDDQTKIAWCRLAEWRVGAARLLDLCHREFLARHLEDWFLATPILYPFLREATNPGDPRRSVMDEVWRRYLCRKYPPQLTLYLTDRCQLRCPYCFAVERVNQSHRELPWEQVERLLDYAKEQRFTFISLTGGEPTLYSQFPQLVEGLQVRGLEFYFSTNLLFPPALRPWVEQVYSLEMHLCDPQDYTPSYLKQLQANLEWAAGQPFHKLFRYNLWRRNPKDWQWVMDLVGEFPGVELAFAVPFPSPGGKNFFIPRESLESFAEVVVEFVRHCDDKKIRVIAAKPYPLCAFSGEEALYLLQRGALRGTCEVGASGCQRNWLVDPDLRVLPCIGLDPSPGPITSLSSPQAAAEKLPALIRALLDRVDYAKCRHCELRAWKLCMGGCLAYYHTQDGGQ